MREVQHFSIGQSDVHGSSGQFGGHVFNPNHNVSFPLVGEGVARRAAAWGDGRGVGEIVTAVVLLPSLPAGVYIALTRRISQFSSAPNRTIISPSHTHIRKPTIVASEP